MKATRRNSLQELLVSILQIKFFDAPLRNRVIFALIAGLLWFPLMELADYTGASYDLLPIDFRHPSVSAFFGWFLIWGSGGVFSALVLLPYLQRGTTHFAGRIALILLMGAASYYLAVHLVYTLDIPLFPFPESIASPWGFAYALGVYGTYAAVVIGAGARYIIPLALRWSGWVLLTLAGFLGGALVGIGVTLWDIPGWSVHVLNLEYNLWFWPGHIAWEILVCMAIFYGRKH